MRKSIQTKRLLLKFVNERKNFLLYREMNEVYIKSHIKRIQNTVLRGEEFINIQQNLLKKATDMTAF